MDERWYARWGKVLLHDGRQGLVGGVALLAAGALGTLLLQAVAGSVPAWTLAVVGVVALVAVSGLAGSRLGLEGRLAGAAERIASLENRNATLEEDLRRVADGDVSDPRFHGLLLRIAILARDAKSARDDRNLRDASQTRVNNLVAIIRDAEDAMGKDDRVIATARRDWIGWEGGAVIGTNSSLVTTLGQLEAMLQAQTMRDPTPT